MGCEAASVEGASSVQRFFKITLPLLKPTILIVLLIRLLDAFRVHDLFWVMGVASSRPSPSTSTRTCC
jgi:multiple sugar transport system permease protein